MFYVLKNGQEQNDFKTQAEAVKYCEDGDNDFDQFDVIEIVKVMKTGEVKHGVEWE